MKTIVALLLLLSGVFCAPPLDEKVYFIVAPNAEEKFQVQDVTDNVMSRLKQIQGSDSGVYNVYLPDGRLQRVQHTKAPLEESQESQEIKKETETPKKPSVPVFKGVKTVPLPVQEEKEETKDVKKVQGYIASIAYTNVEPIQGPFYAYYPEQLTRTVRYAPKYVY